MSVKLTKKQVEHSEKYACSCSRGYAATDISGCSVWTDYTCQCAPLDEGDLDHDFQSCPHAQITLQDVYDEEGEGDLAGMILGILLEMFRQYVNNDPKEDSLKCVCGEELRFKVEDDLSAECTNCHTKMGLSTLTDYSFADHKPNVELQKKVTAWGWREARKAEKEAIGDPPGDWTPM